MQAETSHGGSCGKAYFGGDSTRLTKGDNFCGKKRNLSGRRHILKGKNLAPRRADSFL